MVLEFPFYCPGYQVINPCPAELFQLYFSSFEAEFQLQMTKNIPIHEKQTCLKLNYWIN